MSKSPSIKSDKILNISLHSQYVLLGPSGIAKQQYANSLHYYFFLENCSHDEGGSQKPKKCFCLI